MPKVFAVSGTDPYENTTKILEKAGSEFLDSLKSPLVIKPNLVGGSQNVGATTNPQTVKAIIEYIQANANVDSIVIADGSSSDTEKVFDTLGYRTIFDAMGIKLHDLNKDQPVWINGIEPLTERPMKIPIAQTVLNARYLISVALPKTHDHGIVTLGLKNLVGVIPGLKWKMGLHGGKFPEDLSNAEFERSINGFHKNLLAIFKEVRIDFNIIDGTVGMEGAGPISGKAKKADFGLGGADPVAVDSIGTYLMGYDPYEIGYLYLSERSGLGVADISKIDVDLPKWTKLRQKFKPHPRYSRMHYRP
jgi:uncharacterized protein (DUF362 family)